jgi:hypothetical protein
MKAGSVRLPITEFQNTVFLIQNLRGRDQLQNLGTGRWLILKCTLNKWCLRM